MSAPASTEIRAEQATTQTSQADSLATTAPPPDPTASLWSFRMRGAAAASSPTAGGPVAEGRLLPDEAANAPRTPLTLEPVGPVTAPTRFDVLQKWEGVVTSLETDTFTARLIDLVGDQPDQEATIYVEEISPRDRSRLAPGALFYWYIGYRDDLNGDRERASRIRLRRLPSLTDAELDAAAEGGRQLRARLGWHH